MQITEITVTKGATKNLGDYNNVKAEITIKANLTDGEDASRCTKELFQRASAAVMREIGEAPAEEVKAVAKPVVEEVEVEKVVEAPVVEEVVEEVKNDEPPMDRDDFNKAVGRTVKAVGHGKVMSAFKAFGVSKAADVPADQRRAFLDAAVA